MRTSFVIADGPSPRGWGIRAGGGILADLLRSIPTWVGNTIYRFRNNPDYAVHPHVGGEYANMRSYSLRYFGPSPRGWGIRCGCGRRCGCCRSIPTWVGNTVSPTLTASASSVHPHVGGEYLSLFRFFVLYCGPSPRGWGIPIKMLRERVGVRSIPTWVGNTYQLERNCPRPSVHPHVGGEYRLIGEMRPKFVGPSPRGWGIHQGPTNRRYISRSIPTWVGNTFAAARTGRCKTVHPHVGGEYKLRH